MTAHLTTIQRALARRLRAKGMSLGDIAKEVGCRHLANKYRFKVWSDLLFSGQLVESDPVPSEIRPGFQPTIQGPLQSA